MALINKYHDFDELIAAMANWRLPPWMYYTCILHINVGCPLSQYDDLFWNIEHLSA